MKTCKANDCLDSNHPKHMPKWEIGERGGQVIIGSDDGKWVIATLHGPDAPKAAALIINAVNAYESDQKKIKALVEALKDCIKGNEQWNQAKALEAIHQVGQFKKWI